MIYQYKCIIWLINVCSFLPHLVMSVLCVAYSLNSCWQCLWPLQLVTIPSQSPRTRAWQWANLGWGRDPVIFWITRLFIFLYILRRQQYFNCSDIRVQLMGSEGHAPAFWTGECDLHFWTICVYSMEIHSTITVICCIFVQSVLFKKMHRMRFQLGVRGHEQFTALPRRSPIADLRGSYF